MYIIYSQSFIANYIIIQNNNYNFIVMGHYQKKVVQFDHHVYILILKVSLESGISRSVSTPYFYE